MDLETIKMAAFLDELEKLEKEAGLWGTVADFATRGLRQLGAFGKSVGSKGLGTTLSRYGAAAKQMGPGGFAKAFAPAGAVLGAGALGTYGAYKGVRGILGGGDQK